MKTIKRIKLRYWLIGSFALGVLMLMLAIRSQFVDVPLRVSPSTTYFTAPLMSDGKSVDYVLALKEKNEDTAAIQSEENGFRFLVKNLTNFEDWTGRYSTLCDELNLKTGEKHVRATYYYLDEYVERYSESNDYDEEFILKLAKEIGYHGGEYEQDFQKFEKYDLRSILFNRCTKPWKPGDVPAMETWLKANEHSLKIVAHAASKKQFLIPLVPPIGEKVSWFEYFHSGFYFFLDLGPCFLVRANMRLGTGDIDGAIDDLETSSRIGEYLQKMPYSTWQYVGNRNQLFCMKFGVNGSADYTPRNHQLERITTVVSTEPSRRRYKDSLLEKRILLLERIREKMPDADLSEEEYERLLKLGINWNIVAHRVNQRFDLLEKDIDAPRPEKPDEWTFWDTISIRHRSERFATAVTREINTKYRVEQAHEYSCQSQIYQITLAMLIYEKDHGTLPPAFTVDANGKRLHSWRVLLLPYLGQNELYQKIRLDEPWDSAHNKKFWTHSVPIYQCPADKQIKPGECNYTVIVGPDSAFRGSDGVKSSEFRKVPVDTILVTEITTSFCWMDPNQDITQETIEAGPSKRIGNSFRSPDYTGLSANHNRVYFGLHDGSVQYFSGVSFESVHEQVVPILKGTSSKSAFD